MSPQNPLITLLLFLFFISYSELFHICSGDVGAAGYYNSPYIPTQCYGDDATEFPSNNLFVAAGDGIWDNGAACGRQYVVRCISAPVPASCVDPEAIIQVKVVDYVDTAISISMFTSGTTMFLSQTAFGFLVNSTTSDPTTINIEFQQ